MNIRWCLLVEANNHPSEERRFLKPARKHQAYGSSIIFCMVRVEHLNFYMYMIFSRGMNTISNTRTLYVDHGYKMGCNRKYKYLKQNAGLGFMGRQ
eukprot:gene9110-biopygen2779